MKSKSDLYLNAFIRTLEEYKNNLNQNKKPIVKKLITYGVKAINSDKKHNYTTYEEIQLKYNLIEEIKTMMSSLTPNEFINLFPIKKEYDGDKFEMKDYFYTIEYIKKIGENKIIDKNIDEFLWEYMNIEISMFTVNSIGVIDDLLKFNGHKTMFEQFAEDNNIKIHKIITDNNGKEFLYDPETNKYTKLKKPKPKYLKLIKPNKYKNN